MLKKQLVCNYDEFSVNSYMNRIIRTTMDISVKTLDLDCDFSMIREQLDGIVQSCFEWE